MNKEGTQVLKGAVLFTALYSLYLMGASIDLTITVQAGKTLASSDNVATFPYALIGLGTILAARYGMQAVVKMGLRNIMLLSSSTAVLSGLGSFLALKSNSFTILCISIFLIGVYSGFSNYYRLLVTEFVPVEDAHKAISLCLSGGIISACVGPPLALLISKGEHYRYAYILVAFLGIFAFILANLLPKTVDNSKFITDANSELITDGQLIRGKNFEKRDLLYAGLLAMMTYFVMSIIMTSGPLELQQKNISFIWSSLSIQSHMIGMFLPALFLSVLIDRYSVKLIINTGLLIGVIGLLFALSIPTPKYFIFTAMLFGGLFWALSYGGTSFIIATKKYSRQNPKFRGIVEMLSPIGLMLGALVAGVAHELIGFEAILLVGSTILGFCLIMHNFLIENRRIG